MQFLKDRLDTMWRTEAPLRKMFFGLLFVAVLCHFYRLSNFLLSIDDEYGAVRADPTVWISQGRWTIYWVERLFLTQPTLPFFPDALFCFGITIAYLLLLKSHRIVPGPMAYILFPLFCAFPSLTVLGEFYANVPSLGLGFVLCTLAIALGQKLNTVTDRVILTVGWLFHGLCVAASIGCYQPFVLVYAAFCLGTLLCAAADDPHIDAWALCRAHGRIIVQVVACFVLYLAVQKLHLRLVASGEGYIANIMRLDLLWADSIGVLKAAFADMCHIYGGKAGFYGIRIRAFVWVMVWGTAGFVASLGHRASWARAAVTAVLVGELVMMPYGFLLASGGHLPFRTFVAVPYVMWLFGYFAQRQRIVLLNALAISCVMWCAFDIVYVNNLYAAEMAVTQQRDRSFAAELYQRLESTRVDFSLSANYQLDVYGMMPRRKSLYPTAISSTTAASFFNWDDGNPLRMVAFMNLLGYSNIHPIEASRRSELTSLFAAMPIWPAEGSVVWQGDTALIKLGALPGVFHPPL